MKNFAMVGLLLGLLGLAQAQTTFTVRITNVSMADALGTSAGAVAVPLAPGVWLSHQDGMPLFSEGEIDRGQGLEALAEDGNPGMLNDYLASEMMAGHFGVFNMPVDKMDAGPLLPGGVYEFSFTANPGDRLSLATMFVQSNDWFYAPAPEGISLFTSDGQAISGDISDQFYLWDAGTEVDEEPGTGAHQAPRQMGPNDGEAQGAGVAKVEVMTHGPILQVTIESK
ncbi:MAG: spondin domain-containing protein [Trueperaceae bacterium]|nr:spondin domain-containing protein [Trueperaceae bacterium]